MQTGATAPRGAHRPSAGGQLGGGGTGRPQPPGQPDVRQRVGRQGARRYTRGSGRRRAGRTMTGTVAVLPAAPIPSIAAAQRGCLPALFILSTVLHAVSARPGAPFLSSVGVYLTSLVPSLHQPPRVNFPRGSIALANDAVIQHGDSGNLRRAAGHQARRGGCSRGATVAAADTGRRHARAWGRRRLGPHLDDGCSRHCRGGASPLSAQRPPRLPAWIRPPCPCPRPPVAAPCVEPPARFLATHCRSKTVPKQRNRW